jgi:alpha-beta hydrolase superfamily lysophospholipase
LEQRLNALGIGTIRYDHYGHSSRPRSPHEAPVAPDITLSKALSSLRAVVSYARSLDVSVALLGSSFGGLVSLLHGTDPSIVALVLKSPVVEPVSFWKNRVGEEGLRKWQDTGAITYERNGVLHEITIGFWHDLQQFNSVQIASNIRCPILVVHGDSDRVVPLAQSELLTRVTGCTLKVLPGVDHAYSGPGEIDLFIHPAVDFLSGHLMKE